MRALFRESLLLLVIVVLYYVRDIPRFVSMAQDTEIARRWPLHWMVWNNDVIALASALKDGRMVSNNLML